MLAVGLLVGIVFLIKSFGSAAAVRQLPFAENENFAFTGKGFAYISHGQLNYFDLSDEDKNYSMKINQDNARVCAAENITVIHNSSALRVVNTPYDTEVNGIIEKIVCGANYAALLRRGEDGKTALKAFDSTGAQCYQLEPDRGIFTDFGFESSGSPTLWISQLVTAGDTFTTTVTTYDLSRKSVTGVFSVEGQLVKNVFITKKSVFLFCTGDIIRYDRNTNNESYRILAYGYECLSASFYKGKGWFVLRNKSAESSSVRLLTAEEGKTADETAYLITLPSDVMTSLVMNGRFIAVSPDKLVIYAVNDAKRELVVRHTEEFDRPVSAALKLNESKILLTKDGEQLLYSIKQTGS